MLTQERLFERDDIKQIDFFVIDEFYKLAPSRGDDRTKLLNVVLHRFRKTANQLFLLGPRIPNISISGLFDAVFVDDDTITVAADIINLSRKKPIKRAVYDVLKSHEDEKSIVYCKSPNSVTQLANSLVDSQYKNGSSECDDAADWLERNYHPAWSVPRFLRYGIGLHHGGLPRSVAQWMLRLFDDGRLNVLLCTSTLIEGVNTKAKNVLIYDKKVSNIDFDFFTYSNIKGRAGRMSKHLVGRVYLFYEPPSQTSFEFEIPALMAEAAIPDDYVFSFDDANLTTGQQQRKDRVIQDMALPRHVTDQLARYKIDQIKNAALNGRKAAHARNPNIFWRGYADFDHLYATLTLAWDDLAPGGREPKTARQAAFYVDRLRKAASLRGFLEGLVQGKDNPEKQVEIALSALRKIEFHVPAVLRATELMVNHYRRQLDLEQVDYSPMASMIEHYFLPPIVAAAEEIGIPLPLAQKLLSRDRDEAFETFVTRIGSATEAEFTRRGLSAIEVQLVSAALS